MQTLKKTCCLGMVALCASVSFAAGELQTTATFEAPTQLGSMNIHLNDDGSENRNMGYWTLNGDVNQEEIGDQATIKAYEVGAAPTGGGAQYLSLDLQDRLDRNIKLRSTAGDAASPEADNIAEGEGSLYFDSLVQFTASDAESGVDLMANTDKLLVWLKEAKTAEDGTVTPAQLMVTAGYLENITDYTLIKKDYGVTLPDGVTLNPEEWHRLTIQALKRVIPLEGFEQSYEINFRILIDGKAVTYTEAKGGVDTPQASLEADLFPAFVPTYSQNDYATLTAATFKGMGAVDNLAWSRENPLPAVETEVTFTLGDGIKNVIVTVGNEETTYTSTTTLKIAGDYDYVFTPAEDYCAPEVVVEGNRITATSVLGNVSVNGLGYKTIADAVSAVNAITEGNRIVKLLSAITEENETNVSVDFILNLNGQSFTTPGITADKSVTIIGSGAILAPDNGNDCYFTVVGGLTIGTEQKEDITIGIIVATDVLTMNTGVLKSQPVGTNDDNLPGTIKVPTGMKLAEADGVWKLVTDGGEEPKEDPSVTAGADAGNVAVDASAKTITVSVSTGTELTVANASDYTISVPANVAKINGAVKAVVVKAGALDITGAFTVTTAEGVTTIALNKNGSVKIGDETVTVDPAVADVATGAAAAVTVKTIPGLTYTLLRATAVKGSTYAAVETTAVTVNATTTTLTDGSTDRPVDAAFYKVQVTR